ncbi:MAG TPA: MFS transporter [Casimicrobiaceae bacterium]|nr:MFS transporter [Casimicrobiaceae bacterium]
MGGSHSFVRIYTPFAAGYFLSYVFRTVNAVISPELSRDLALSPAALGLLTSAYFIAFGAMQIPAGMLLDRYGPRRVEPAFLLIAGTGSIAFGMASGESSLLLARALIGAGVSTCLMAPLKGIVTWYAPERHASLSGWMMVAGGLGALVVTAPLEIVLRYITWHTVFVLVGVATYVVAAWMWWRVPDLPRARDAVGFGAQWSGVRLVFATPRFWWLAPLGLFGMGGFTAIQGLWSVPWMMEVQGFDRASAARHLFVLSIVTLCGFVALGALSTRLARRGIQTRHLFAAGFLTNVIALAGIVAQLPGSYLWWGLYGLGFSVNVLGFAVLSEGFPSELTARANTALNLLMFTGSFLLQWGIGVVVTAAEGWLGFDKAAGLRLAFSTILIAEAIGYLWFTLGWRRHASQAYTIRSLSA